MGKRSGNLSQKKLIIRGDTLLQAKDSINSMEKGILGTYAVGRKGRFCGNNSENLPI